MNRLQLRTWQVWDISKNREKGKEDEDVRRGRGERGRGRKSESPRLYASCSRMQLVANLSVFLFKLSNIQKS